MCCLAAAIILQVIDTGIRPTHTDFAGNLVPRLTVTGMNRVTNRAQLPVPVSLTAPPFNAAWAEHGTHVSGTVFARWDNGASTAVGVVGKALGGNCECGIAGDTPSGLPAALNPACLNGCIRYANQAGNVRVINLSYTSHVQAQATSAGVPDQEREAIQAFCSSGGIVVISAGNGEQATDGAPFIGVNVIRPTARIYPAALAQDLAG
jgi:subtilisin family serine protease